MKNVSKYFLALSFFVGAFVASEGRAEMFGMVPPMGIRAPGPVMGTPNLIGCSSGMCGGNRGYTRIVQTRVIVPVGGTHGFSGGYGYNPYGYGYGMRPYYNGRGCNRCAKRCHGRCRARCGHCRRGIRGGFALNIQTPRFGFGLAIF